MPFQKARIGPAWAVSPVTVRVMLPGASHGAMTRITQAASVTDGKPASEITIPPAGLSHVDKTTSTSSLSW
jgi:hypothetical protein